MKTATSTLQATLWSKGLSRLNLEKDKVYIVHQILAFGSLEEIDWLFKKFSRKEIIEIFAKHPQKIYTRSQLNFAKEILLGVKTPINEKKYLKTPS